MKDLSRIPKRRVTATQRGARKGSTRACTPALAHIAEQLRPLARPIQDIEFLAGNPRLHGDKNLDGIRASLRQFGQYQPVVINKRKSPPVVIAGNGRLQAALSLNWTHIAAVEVDVDDNTAKQIAIADNRTSEMADWNSEALKAMMAGIEVKDGELDRMLKELLEEHEGKHEGIDVIAQIMEVEVKEPPEMVWVLVGLPLDRFGEAQASIAALQELADVTVQSNR